MGFKITSTFLAVYFRVSCFDPQKMKSWWRWSPLGPVNSNGNSSNIERDPEIIVDIKSALDLEPDKRPECCIYRVPQKLRKVNEDAYAPMLISIGPFHQGKENLKKM